MNTEQRPRRRVSQGTRWWVIAASTSAAALLLSLSITPSAMARPDRYQEIFRSWSGVISDLERRDTGATKGDIELLRTWLGQAQALHASKETKQLDPLLVRMKALASYIQVKQSRVTAQQEASKVSQKAAEAERVAIRAKRRADQAELKMKKLEERGL